MSKPRLSVAQKREYELLKKHGSVYVAGWKRRPPFEKLVELGLAETDGSWNWFHLKEQKS